MSRIDGARAFLPLNIAVLTVSDTRSLAEDKSGDILAARIEEAGHKVLDRALVRDEVPAIVEKLKGWIADPKVDAVISTGGTGLTGRDVTPEATVAPWEVANSFS